MSSDWLAFKNFRMKTKLLEECDVIELGEGHKVYADIPEHFAYSNRRGSFKPTHAEAVIGGELAYLAGRYIVYKTTFSGGGTGHGPHDVYPDGHHVYAEREDGTKVDFYQTGCFTAMIPEIAPVGRATRQWVFKANTPDSATEGRSPEVAL